MCGSQEKLLPAFDRFADIIRNDAIRKQNLFANFKQDDMRLFM
ncbi:hypothetical protein CHCC20375_2474 [Bacillus licheniformis]|nr:hypothetical protein CHCC20375_2474 [Bacillus licheniformis]